MSRGACPNCGSTTGLGDIHCFKCGYIIQYKITPGYFIKEKQRHTQVLGLRNNVVLNPSKFAPKALAWLYKAGIYDDVILKQQIAYCPDIEKVLIPAFKDDVLMFYQLRSLNPQDKAKYITYGANSTYTIHYNDIENKRVVITEDHLSGMRLRPFENVVCLSGTALHSKAIEALLDNYSDIVFWLDPDLAGENAVRKQSMRLKWYASKYNIRRMFMGKNSIDYKYYKINSGTLTKDPKFYLDNELVKALTTQLVQL